MSQMEKKAFLVVTSHAEVLIFLYYNSPGESIHTYIGIYKKELLLIYKFCVADFVPSCNVLIAFDMLILDTKEVNRINIGIDKVGAKFTLMFAFQEISCQTLAVLF